MAVTTSSLTIRQLSLGNSTSHVGVKLALAWRSRKAYTAEVIAQFTAVTQSMHCFTQQPDTLVAHNIFVRNEPAHPLACASQLA